MNRLSKFLFLLSAGYGIPIGTAFEWMGLVGSYGFPVFVCGFIAATAGTISLGILLGD